MLLKSNITMQYNFVETKKKKLLKFLFYASFFPFLK